jgi:hypothetical protein
MRTLVLFALAAALFIACKKEEVGAAVPEIALIDASPLQVVQFGQRVKVRFSFKDADGDLGHADPDIATLEVKEARLDTPDMYHVPPIAPEGAEVSVQGELEVELNALFLLGNGSTETTTYTLRIRDRAGNWSNAITTPTITIAEAD